MLRTLAGAAGHRALRTARAKAQPSRGWRRLPSLRRSLCTKEKAAEGGASRVRPQVVDEAAQSKAQREAQGSGSGALFAVTLGVAGSAGFVYAVRNSTQVRDKLSSSGLDSVVQLLSAPVPKPAISTATKGLSTADTLPEGAEEEAVPEPAEPASSPETVSASQDDGSANQPPASESVSAGDTEDEASGRNQEDEQQQGEQQQGEQLHDEQQQDEQQQDEQQEQQEQQGGADNVAAPNDASSTATAVVTAEQDVLNAENAAAEEMHAQEDAAAELVPEKRSDVDRLQDEISDIQASIGDKQKEVRRSTVAELRVREAQLRGELETMLARDLTELDLENLRRRIVQLVMELQERNKAEAAQLIAVLEQAEQRATSKANEALQQQAESFQELIDAKLREQESELRDDYERRIDDYISNSNQRLQDKIDELNAAHKEALETKLKLQEVGHEAELASTAAEERSKAAADALAEQAERVAMVEELRLQLQALDKIFQQNSDYLRSSHQIHLISTALLALHNALERGSDRSLASALASLQVAGKSDKVISVALDSLPRSAMAGVATLPQLERRFAVVREESRKAFYTSEDSGIVGHTIGSVTAGLYQKPDGLVEGSGTEARLARAHYHVAAGDLPKALAEIDAMEGDAAAVLVDWAAEARNRLLVEQAVRMISAHVMTVAATLA